MIVRNLGGWKPVPYKPCLGGLGALETDTKAAIYLVWAGGLAAAGALIWFLFATKER